MELIRFARAWYCNLLHRTFTQAPNWCPSAHSWLDSAHLRWDQSHLILALKNNSIRRKVNFVLIMALLILFPCIYFSFSHLCLSHVALLYFKLICASCVSLLVALTTGTAPPFLQSEASFSIFCGILLVLSLFAIEVTSSSSPSLCRLIMVWHRMNSRYGGSCGGRGRSQRAQSVDKNPAPSSMPVSQLEAPPLNPPCRPFSHSPF